ncbi:hypothetical protein Dsin_031760 [Dipteronia sinensis]|uniref:F-box domain-containing protein n=1 Tax=Dipteronia sinensis TaxID=43782 RepID=A0AAE0DSM9_9ROSI|nr:hypothetical protein Dsin_031760 [Dipteronia sinensis]
MESISDGVQDKIKLREGTPTRTIKMECLPHEIVFNILSRLPITSLVKIKFVCRAWCDLTLHSHLISSHFLHQIENDPCLILHSDHPIRNQIYFLDLSADVSENDKRVKQFSAPPAMPPEFVIIGSCNGLLCLKGPSPWNKLYIYNPFTRDQLELPGSTLDSDKDQVFEFGFHPSTKEYKVIKIVYDKIDTLKVTNVHILTLGRSSSTWRSIGNLPYRFVHHYSRKAFVNGRFHWVFLPQNLVKIRHDSFLLVSFDLADEKFQEVPKPACPGALEEGISHLAVLGGCLAVAGLALHASIEIYVMKNYNVKESWIKEYSIGRYYFGRDLDENVVVSSRLLIPYLGGPLRVLCLLKNGEILLHYMHRVLVTYNPKSGSFKDLSFPGMMSWFQTFVHVGSLSWIDTATAATGTCTYCQVE